MHPHGTNVPLYIGPVLSTVDVASFVEQLVKPNGGFEEADRVIREGSEKAVTLLLQQIAPVIETLMRRLEDEDSEVRHAAARAFGSPKVDAHPVSEKLAQMAQEDPDPTARDGAVEALRELNMSFTESESIETSLEALQSSDPQEREAAIETSGRVDPARLDQTGRETLVASLVHQLNHDDDYQARMSSALALKRLNQQGPDVLEATRMRGRNQISCPCSRS